MKKLIVSLGLSLSLISLAACSSQKKAEQSADPSTMKTSVIPKNEKAPHQDIRLKFNDIKVASAADEFKGGTTLEQLKSTFGEPASHETVPAGDVKLDLYTWNFDQVHLSVHLFENSAIVRTISNFQFIREQTITRSTVDALKVTTGDVPGDSFKTISEKLGQPDVMSQAISSDKEEIEAIWTSGLKTDTGATLKLFFVNNSLVTKEQTGLKD